jgi:hypothetical protein
MVVPCIGDQLLTPRNFLYASIHPSLIADPFSIAKTAEEEEEEEVL